MEPVARFENLHKCYGATTVVDDLTFSVPDRTVTGLLGPNGAGKTTSIRVLLGLAKTTRGRVEVLGAEPRTPEFAAVLRQVGALIEGPALYGNATARQNLRIETAAREVERPEVVIDELLELVGLREHADRKAGKYSLGMRQRLGLALALVSSPRLVVLDEPTNGLDPAGIVEIRKLIKRLPERGISVLVSSHLLAEVQLMCDRAAIIHHGKLIAEGTISELLASGTGAGYRVLVTPGEEDVSVFALRAHGLAAEPEGPGRLTVTGTGPDDGALVTRVLAQQGVYLNGLANHAPSLEEVFLDLTTDRELVA